MGTDERLPFLARRLPSSFERRVITISPGRERIFHEGEWRDAIVVVELGEIELECVGGARGHARRGDVLWLSGLQLCSLHNGGDVPVVLVAVRRRRVRDAANRLVGPAARD